MIILIYLYVIIFSLYYIIFETRTASLPEQRPANDTSERKTYFLALEIEAFLVQGTLVKF